MTDEAQSHGLKLKKHFEEMAHILWNDSLGVYQNTGKMIVITWMYWKVWDLLGCKGTLERRVDIALLSGGIVLISFLPHSWYRVVVWIQYEIKLIATTKNITVLCSVYTI